MCGWADGHAWASSGWERNEYYGLNVPKTVYINKVSGTIDTKDLKIATDDEIDEALSSFMK